MDLTISRPVKILALVAVLVAVGGAGSMTLLGRKAPPAPLPSAAQLQAEHRAQEKLPARTTRTATTAARAGAKTAAHAAPKPAATHAASKPAVTHAAQPAAKPKPRVETAPKPVAKAESAPLVDSSGLPMVLADELRAHRIVVVALFDPQSQTDAVSYAEAQAGAAEAGAGFLGVSLLDNAVAGPLTALLPGGGLLPDPGVLVYRAPGTLVERLDGFQDRDTVAQAATEASTAPALSAAPPATTTTP